MILMMSRALLLLIPSSLSLIVSARLISLYGSLGVVAEYGGFILVHKDDISREQLKELLYEEIMSFRPPAME